MDSPTERERAAPSRRGLLAGAAGLLALVCGRRRRSQDTPAGGGPGQPREPGGRLPWIGHY